MRTADNKSDLKKTLNVLTSSRTEENPSVTVVDGSAYLWNTQWPAKGTVNDYISSFLSRIVKLLKHTNVYLVFDRYYENSIKKA